MHFMRADTFQPIYRDFAETLRNCPPVNVGEWQSQKVSHPSQQFLELPNAVLELPIPQFRAGLVNSVKPNLPWAEDHFQERISGKPLNPPPSSAYWPFTQSGHGGHVDTDKKFSHTYPERFWPKHAGHDAGNCKQPGYGVPRLYGTHPGIRYAYGDLQDVAELLKRSPYTRQAYLPVWFPEDTGNVMEQRVPCTLGYHFQYRKDQLDCTYLIRSCDFFRHFPDDVYMAGRLMQWMAMEMSDPLDDEPVRVGTLTMHIMNLHTFVGERARLLHVVNYG